MYIKLLHYLCRRCLLGTVIETRSAPRGRSRCPFADPCLTFVHELTIHFREVFTCDVTENDAQPDF